MQKRAPTLGNLLVIVLFCLSCFGLLLFLWESFGGPLPFKPTGYRMTVALPRTLSLADESDVKISGVDVGHVVSLKLGKDGLTHVTFDDILSLLNKTTRSNFQAWMKYQAAAVAGRGEQINSSIAEFEPFVEHTNQLVAILAS